MTHRARLSGITILAAALAASPALATPVQLAQTLHDVDFTWAAIGGVGGECGFGGSATLTLSGVGGPVTHAYLYWHGVDGDYLVCPPLANAAKGGAPGAASAGGSRAQGFICDGVYDHPTILFNGTPVTGTPIGDATTNCWGEGSSRAYRADVTSLVSGNGAYTLSDLTTDDCDDVNGASLIVTYDDGNVLNDRDVVLFEGNDSNLAADFPGEDDGWHAVLAGIHYTDGPASVQLHVADGQRFFGGLDDNSLSFSVGGSPLVIGDQDGLYDGGSVDDAGNSRSERDGTEGVLWDVHDFDVTSLFTGENTYSLTMDGQLPFGDCLGLVLLVVNLDAGSVPVPTVQRSWGSLKSSYR